jgi:hypothetical protein
MLDILIAKHVDMKKLYEQKLLILIVTPMHIYIYSIRYIYIYIYICTNSKADSEPIVKAS